jgi:hypothetical protein
MVESSALFLLQYSVETPAEFGDSFLTGAKDIAVPGSSPNVYVPKLINDDIVYAPLGKINGIPVVVAEGTGRNSFFWTYSGGSFRFKNTIKVGEADWKRISRKLVVSGERNVVYSSITRVFPLRNNIIAKDSSIQNDGQNVNVVD